MRRKIFKNIILVYFKRKNYFYILILLFLYFKYIGLNKNKTIDTLFISLTITLFFKKLLREFKLIFYKKLYYTVFNDYLF